MRARCLIRPMLMSCFWGFVITSGVHAQFPAGPPKPPRGLVGISATLARPVGEFQEYVSWGGGITLSSVINLNRKDPIGIRIDGSLIDYGLESEPGLLTAGNRIQRSVRINTNNLILSLGVGPQLTFGFDRIRPYLFATVGFSYFLTVTSANPVPGGEPLVSETNFDDFRPAVSAGAGLLFRLGKGTYAPAIDLSVHSQYNGETSYLRHGSITDNLDGSISFDPIRSNANLVSLRLGVTFGV